MRGPFRPDLDWNSKAQILTERVKEGFFVGEPTISVVELNNCIIQDAVIYILSNQAPVRLYVGDWCLHYLGIKKGQKIYRWFKHDGKSIDERLAEYQQKAREREEYLSELTQLQKAEKEFAKGYTAREGTRFTVFPDQMKKRRKSVEDKICPIIKIRMYERIDVSDLANMHFVETF